jgi:hypothetical protein
VLQAGQSTETTKIGAAPTLLSHLQKEQAGYASSHESVTGNTLTAGGNVTLAAKGGDLTLVSGKVTAEGDIALAASGKVAVTGMVTKDSTRDAEWRINYNGDSPQTTKLNETGSEKFNWTGSALSGDNLSIQSGKDTIFVGSDAKMRGGVLIDAKGDIIFGPMDAKGELFGSMDAKGNIFGSAVEHKIEKPQNGVLFLFGATSTNESTVWRESRIEAGGGITALADGKFILNAGQITTPGAVWIDAKEGVQIGSLLSIEQQNLPFKLTKQSFALAEARIEGSNIAIKSGADMNLVAAKIGGSGDVRLDAQGNITAESLMSGTSNPSNRDLKAQTTELRAEGNLTVKSAGGDIRATGLEAHAGKDLSLSAAGDIKLMSVVDEAYRVKEKSSGGFFSKTTTETWSDETVRGAQLTSGGRMELKAGNELELEAANLKGKEGITLDANKIILSMADEKHFYSKVKDNDYMGVWQSNANKGSTQVVGVETVLESEGPIKINARENLVVEYAQRKGESAEDAQARAFAKTDLWQIETNNPTGSPLILTGKADGLNTWSTSHQGLGTVGAMIVAVVVTMVTYGAASAMVGSAAGATAGSGSAMAAAGTTAGSAGAGWANVALASGMSSMASSAAVQLGTNGKLDWNQIGKSGLSATLTAGILNYPGLADGQSLNDMAGFGQNSSGTTQAKNGLFTGEFTSDKAIGLAGRSVVQATVEKTLFGTNFKDGFVNALVSDLAANVAYDIGSTWGTGDTKNPAAHMLAHAGLGATAAKLTGKDPVAGALGGLTAGIIENVIPEGSINPNNLSDRIQVIAGSSLASGIIANMLGKDENVAMGATKNAIENNYLSPKQLMQVEQAMADCKGNPLCEQQVKQSAQALSASQDLELSWAKFLCQFSVCADRNNREGVIEASFDPARFIPEIQAAHPGWSLDQVQNEATRYLTEAQNSLDASTWRTVFGTLDVASAVAVAIAPLAAGAANVPKTGAGVVSEVPQIALNRQSGAAFESQVIEAFGHVGGVKNTAPVTVQLPNGAQVTTIPDLWGKNVGGLLEVKNVQNLSMSNQLRAQIKVASDTGQPLNLVVSPRTNNVSAELMRQVRSTGGDVYRYNPITGDLTRF